MITLGGTWVGRCKYHARSRPRARDGFGSDFGSLTLRASAFSSGSLRAMGPLKKAVHSASSSTGGQWAARRWKAWPALTYSSLHTRLALQRSRAITETPLTPFGSMSTERLCRTRVQRSEERGVPEFPQPSPGGFHLEIFRFAASAAADHLAEHVICLAAFNSSTSSACHSSMAACASSSTSALKDE